MPDQEELSDDEFGELAARWREAHQQDEQPVIIASGGLALPGLGASNG